MGFQLRYEEVLKLNTLYYVRCILYTINLSLSVLFDIVERGNNFVESTYL